MDEPNRDPDATAEASVVDPGYALAERVRAQSFKIARRGYDRDEVDGFLSWLADELRSLEVGGSGGETDPDAIRRELERVGESTATILRAAEQTARELRGAAKRDADKQLASARSESERLRAEAEEEARRTRLEASERSEETVRQAEARAEALVEDAVQQRRQLAARLDQLVSARDSIVAEVARISDDLRAIAESELADAEVTDEELEEGDGEELADEELEVEHEHLTEEPEGDEEDFEAADEATQEFAAFRDPDSGSNGDR
jgi:DivIVA domain-containing protein